MMKKTSFSVLSRANRTPSKLQRKTLRASRTSSKVRTNSSESKSGATDLWVWMNGPEYLSIFTMDLHKFKFLRRNTRSSAHTRVDTFVVVSTEARAMKFHRYNQHHCTDILYFFFLCRIFRATSIGISNVPSTPTATVLCVIPFKQRCPCQPPNWLITLRDGVLLSEIAKAHILLISLARFPLVTIYFNNVPLEGHQDICRLNKQGPALTATAATFLSTHNIQESSTDLVA